MYIGLKTQRYESHNESYHTLVALIAEQGTMESHIYLIILHQFIIYTPVTT